MKRPTHGTCGFYPPTVRRPALNGHNHSSLLGNLLPHSDTIGRVWKPVCVGKKRGMNKRNIGVITMSIVCVATAHTATATDLIRRPPAPIAEPLFSAPVGTTWSGFYVGGNLGAALDPNDLSIKDLSAEQDLTLKFSPDTTAVCRLATIGRWVAGCWA